MSWNRRIDDLGRGLLAVALLTGLSMGGDFRRGDVNNTGSVDIGDMLQILEYVLGEDTPEFVDCGNQPELESGDINDNEYVTIADYLRFEDHVGCGNPLPFSQCGPDVTGAGQFPSLQPDYVASLTVVPGQSTVNVALRIDTPEALRAVTLMLDFGPDVTNPHFDLNPILEGTVNLQTDGTILRLTLVRNGCETLVGAGDDQLLGTLQFDGPQGACPNLIWLPEAVLDGREFIATFVDESAVDHHPDSFIETICDPPFIRADANVDGQVDIADAIKMLTHLFDNDPVDCEQAVDANDDDLKNIADPIYTLDYLFSQGPPPPPPYPDCGTDPTLSLVLSCESFDLCP